MNRATPPILVIGLVAAAPAFAQSTPWITDTYATVGGIVTNRSGRDFSKIEEYQDLRDGVLSNIWSRGRDDRTWYEFYGENFGRDDQFINLDGGQYSRFRYNLYTNWVPHNFLYNGATPFDGAGTPLQTAQFPRPDPSTWNGLNMGYQRKDTGGYFEWRANTPWYFRVDANQVTFDGSKVGSAALGTSPGNGFADLAFPVSYTTSTASGEVGYSTSTMHFALNYLYSRFNNDNTSFQWTNPFFGGNLDTTYLANDNHYQRIGANAVIRGLPYSSTFAARYTWSKTTNDMSLPLFALTSGSGGTGVFVPTLPNTDSYNGELINQTLSLSLNSTPIKNVDTKAYYNYYSLDNHSTQVAYSAESQIDCGGPCTNLLYDYRKHNAGLEAIWRIDRANRLSGGWDYLDIEQNRVDFDSVQYNKFWVEWKNSSLDTVTTRLRYHYLQRRSDFLLGDSGTGPNDPEFINRYIARFDNSDLNQNYVRFTADWSPMDLLDTSVEAIYKHNDYTNTVLGRTKDQRYELFGTVSYGKPSLRVTLMGDYEWVKYDSYHRNISDSAKEGAFDPFSAANSSNYNWAATNKDDNWLVGVGLDWQATDRLLFKASLQYFRSDGSSDVASQNNFGNPLPISAYDDWKQTALNFKGIYTLNKTWSFTAGYAYERYRYNDVAYDGYQSTIPFPGVTNNTGQSYLNGYRAFTNSSASIFYLLATAHF